MLRKLLHKYVEEVITAGLLLLATAILQVFRSRISALTATISHKTLLPQLLAVSTISCGYLGWKVLCAVEANEAKRGSALLPWS